MIFLENDLVEKCFSRCAYNFNLASADKREVRVASILFSTLWCLSLYYRSPGGLCEPLLQPTLAQQLPHCGAFLGDRLGVPEGVAGGAAALDGGGEVEAVRSDEAESREAATPAVGRVRVRCQVTSSLARKGVLWHRPVRWWMDLARQWRSTLVCALTADRKQAYDTLLTR